MPLTRHCLAIPKAEANFKLNMLITRKSLHLKDWKSQSSLEIEFTELRKKINKKCRATMSIKVQLTVLFTAWTRWLNTLKRFEDFSLPSIFWEFILVTKLRATRKPHLQS